MTRKSGLAVGEKVSSAMRLLTILMPLFMGVILAAFGFKVLILVLLILIPALLILSKTKDNPKDKTNRAYLMRLIGYMRMADDDQIEKIIPVSAYYKDILHNGLILGDFIKSDFDEKQFNEVSQAAKLSGSELRQARKELWNNMIMEAKFYSESSDPYLDAKADKHSKEILTKYLMTKAINFSPKYYYFQD